MVVIGELHAAHAAISLGFAEKLVSLPSAAAVSLPGSLEDGLAFGFPGPLEDGLALVFQDLLKTVLSLKSTLINPAVWPTELESQKMHGNQSRLF